MLQSQMALNQLKQKMSTEATPQYRGFLCQSDRTTVQHDPRSYDGSTERRCWGAGSGERSLQAAFARRMAITFFTTM